MRDMLLFRRILSGSVSVLIKAWAFLLEKVFV